MKPNELPERASPAPSWVDSGLATLAEVPGADQQSVWLGLGPEVIHAPVMRSGSKRIIGMSALAVVVAGLVGVTVVYFLAGGSPDRRGSGRITASQTTAAPRARLVVPSVPASAPPVTAAAAPVTTPAVPGATPEAPVTSAASVVAPAAPGPAELAPSPPSQRSAGGITQERRPAVVPAPPSPARSGGEDLRQEATSEDQPPPSGNQPPPTGAVSPPSPDPTSAPEGFTRVPSKPWYPQAPQ